MKTKNLECRGKVTKLLSNAMFNVKLDGVEKESICYVSGKMSKNFIKPDVGDSVLVEFSPTDLSKGRIVKRF